MAAPIAPEVLAEIRKGYEAGTSVAELSRGFKVRRQTIMGWIKREGWTAQTAQTRPHTVRTLDQAKSNVIDMATHRLKEKLGGDAGIDRLADEMASDLAMHPELCRMAVKMAMAAGNKYLAGKIMPGDKQSEADVLNALLTAYAKAIAMGRESGGLRPGTPSTDTNREATSVRIVRQIVQSPAVNE